MKLFSYLYKKMHVWSLHPHAQYYLAGVSFAESSFFPVPPDIMLITMGLSNPSRAWHHALITTVFSVLGGCFGYLIGSLGMTVIEPYLLSSTYAASYLHIRDWFDHFGIWVIFIAGFSPIPYKLFTITAGMMQMLFLPFVLASIIGRGARFYLVSGLLWFFGERLEKQLRHWIDLIGWLIVILLVIAYFIIHFRSL